MIPYEQVIETVHIDSAEELFRILSPFNESYDLLSNGFIFRGEASEKYSLIPTALRKENISKIFSFANLRNNLDPDLEFEYSLRLCEYMILHNFFVKSDRNGLKIPNIDSLRNSMEIFVKEMKTIHSEWLPASLHELAALAQHYGLPTRLLDWSFDPYISLYFASVNVLKERYDRNDHMVLWALNQNLIEYVNIPYAKVPLVMVNPPYGGNDNLRAQQGILTYWKTGSVVTSDRMPNYKIKTNRTPLDKLLYNSLTENKKFKEEPSVVLYKFLIPCYEAPKLFIALKKLNYDAAKLFPGFEGVSKSMAEIAMLNKLKL